METWEGYRLSIEQKTQWDRNPQARVQLAVQFSGSIDPELLKQAVRCSVAMYEILRTTFPRPSEFASPVQNPSGNAAVEWELLEVVDTDVDALLREEVSRSVDFEEGPFLRAVCVNTLGGERLLVLTGSTMCIDIHGLWLLLRSVQQNYLSQTTGLSNIEYIQYSEWQHDLLEERSALEGHFETLPAESYDVVANWLPTACHGQPEIARIPVSLPGEVLQWLANDSGDCCFALWHSFLYRYFGQPDIVVERAADARQIDELLGGIGPFFRPLPVRHLYTDNESFSEALAALKPDYIMARDQMLFSPHEALSVDVSPSVCGFALYTVPDLDDDGFCLSIVGAYDGSSGRRLALSVIRTGQEVFAELQVDTRYFSVIQGSSIAQQFGLFCQAAYTNPNDPLCLVDILDSLTQATLVEAEVARNEPPKLVDCVHYLFEEQVKRTPDATAVVDHKQHVSYSLLNKRANQVAHFLIGRGIGPGAHVGLYVDQSADAIVGMLGILKSGAAYVPIDLSTPRHRLQQIAEDAGLTLIVTQKQGVEVAEGVADVVELGSQQHRSQSDGDPEPRASLGDLLYVMYTSGSTGVPKGVQVEHRNMVQYLNGIHSWLPFLDYPMSYATVSALSTDMGNTMVFPALVSGGRLHVIDKAVSLDRVTLEAYFRNNDIDCLKIVPTHLATLIDGGDCPAIFPKQFLIVGGEVLRWSLVDDILRLRPICQIINHYGPTETTVGVLSLMVRPQMERYSATVPVGKPMSGCRAYVLNRYKQPVSPGIVGELYVGGPNVTRGYLKNPDLTTDRYVYVSFLGGPNERVYRTGDLVRLLPDGSVEFIGRSDRQVKIRGHRVELGEVESVLETHPEVSMAVVESFDSHGEAQLVAYVRARSQKTLAREAVYDYLSLRVPDYCVPSKIIFVQEIPRMTNGKADRVVLRQSTSFESKKDVLITNDPIAAQVADAWQQVLDGAVFGVDDKFFRIGGNSLKLVKLFAVLRERFPFLKVSDLFEHDTVESLAKHIEEHSIAKP